jgi:hypothetical protein
MNKLTAIGIAYPPDQYPNPVCIPRSYIHTLMAAELHSGVDMNDPQAVAAYAENAGDATTKGWILATPEEYLRGLTDGFEVKRWKIQLEFSDGTKLVMRESEDLEAIKAYAAEVHQHYKQTNHTLQRRPDKGVDIGMMMQNSDGETEFRVFCVFRVAPIPARQYTPIQDQRYPSEVDRKLQEQEGDPPAQSTT